MSPKTRRFLLVVFLIALAFRLTPIVVTPDLPISLDDMFQYDMLARSIAAGNGFRWYGEEDLDLIMRYIDMEVPDDYDPRGVKTSFRAPGYPTFLALVYALCGVGEQRFICARIAQAILGSTLVPLVWLLGQQIGFTRRTRNLAAIIVAVFPLLIAYPLALATENLFVPLLLLALVLLLRASQKQRIGDYALAGLAMGVAALTRSVVAAFLPLAVVWLWWVAPERRSLLRNVAALAATFLLVTIPWAVRNTIVHQQPMWVESALGYDLYVGYHPESTGTFQYGISLDLLPMLDDGERHDRGMEAFWRFVRQDPARVPYLMIRKAGYLWSLDRRALTYFYGNGLLGPLPVWSVVLIYTLACGPLVVLAPLGAIGLAGGRFNRRKMLIVLLMVYYTGIHMMILAEPRFHVPLLPVVVLLAAFALVERPWRESASWQQALALTLIGLLFLNWGLEIWRDWDVFVQLFGPEGHKLGRPY